ncbi:lysoplasmalogenase [Pseudomonas sp. 5P_3.1_Bac2]|uniref:lysoplasmalogenase n=1 Tax=Pseudomonas sp. 5P_3.1_Bac2 TaxID=2971617 RepID=UPI0021C7DF60|nr:lysoplasmalogenase [Pseudomonas sp. 5P_3.1_Bac2]MCU1718444.1 lysoplasmalogenase [Pseudomonas sp. 5P_3.1_Bac2]
MSVVHARLYGLALVLGIAYILLIELQPYPLSWLLKLAPMLIYAVLVWRVIPGAAGRWLAAGYVAAAAGDFFLDYGNRDGLFRQALISFLLNQLAFVVGFNLLGRGRSWRWLWSLPVLAYSVLLALWMVPAALGLQVPVAIYLGCLLLMAVSAARVEHSPGPLWAGAMLFVLADSLIGLNKFVYPFEHAVLVIVSLYFSGQSLIAYGLLRLDRTAARGAPGTVDTLA